MTKSTQTVRELFAGWFENVPQVAGLEESTLERYVEMADLHILPELGKVRLDQLSGQKLTTFYLRLIDKGLSGGTVLNIHRLLHRILESAVRSDILPYNPTDRAERPKRKSKSARVLDVDEASKLVDALEGDPLECYYLFAITTAMRQGEILALTWANVDLDHMEVSIEENIRRIRGKGFVKKGPKTEAGIRRSPLASFLVDALRKHRTTQEEAKARAGDQWEDLNLVFCNRFGRPLEPQNIQRRSYAPLLQRAGLNYLPFHSIRKSSASIMLAMGLDLKTVQAQLGHARADLTLNVYGKPLDSRRREVGKVMEEVLGPEARARRAKKPPAERADQ